MPVPQHTTWFLHEEIDVTSDHAVHRHDTT